MTHTIADGVLRLRAVDMAEAEILPPPGARIADDLDGFVAMATTPRRIGLLLARKSAYAVGIAAGADLVASKVDSSYVQSRTAAGGWSQQRFARRRANQAKAAAGDASDTVARLLLPETGSLAAVVAGGDRRTVDAILADRRLEASQRSSTNASWTCPSRGSRCCGTPWRRPGPYGSGSSIRSKTGGTLHRTGIRSPTVFRLGAYLSARNSACRDIGSCTDCPVQNRRRRPGQKPDQCESDRNHGRTTQKARDSPGILSACSSAKTDRPAPTDVTDDRPVLTRVRRSLAFSRVSKPPP